jgi:hypothetical protein
MNGIVEKGCRNLKRPKQLFPNNIQILNDNMVLGYVLGFPDNHYNMFQGVALPECAKYSDIYSLNTVGSGLGLKPRNTISYTYDGFVIVKEEFKMFCQAEQYLGLEFVELVGAPGVYWFKTQNIVEFDAQGRKTRYVDYSPKCNG